MGREGGKERKKEGRKEGKEKRKGGEGKKKKREKRVHSTQFKYCFVKQFSGGNHFLNI